MPAVHADAVQGLDVALDDHVRVRIDIHRARHAIFAQQVQGGEGRPVGVVAGVVRGHAVELIVRVEAGHLQDALQVQRLDRGVGVVEEVVVVEEIAAPALRPVVRPAPRA
ncbi:hypothetical protein G6F57_015986 [Rhizopus arrhizus]|nr:hypothetical protein G6F57_015986 [Rhizopus arrhizus]